MKTYMFRHPKGWAELRHSYGLALSQQATHLQMKLRVVQFMQLHNHDRVKALDLHPSCIHDIQFFD